MSLNSADQLASIANQQANYFLAIGFTDSNILEIAIPATVDNTDWNFLLITRDDSNKLTVQINGTTLYENTHTEALNLDSDSFIYIGTNIENLSYYISDPVVDDLLISREYESNLVGVVPTDYVINYIHDPNFVVINHYKHKLFLY